jgi:hypothetical protein
VATARFARERNFLEMQREIGLCAKDQHRIIEKWPMGLRLLLPRDADAQQEFDLLQVSGHSGSERYVEWKWKQL